MRREEADGAVTPIVRQCYNGGYFFYF
jgi:hypothetical protein